MGAFRMLWCGLRMTIGCPFNALAQVSCDLPVRFGVLVWVSDDLRVRFGCSGVGFGWHSCGLLVFFRAFFFIFAYSFGALV